MRNFIDVTSVGDLFLRAVDRFGEAEALVFPHLRMSYSELSVRVMNTARSLHGIGVRPGDHVGILMPNTPEFVEAYFAINLLGAVVVPLNARYRQHELGYALADADLVALLTTDAIDEHVNFVNRLYATLPTLRTAPEPTALVLGEAPCLRSVVLIGGKKSYPGVIDRATFADAGARVAEGEIHRLRSFVRVGAPHALVYTSGTTAYPKACILSHEAIVRSWRGVREKLQIVPGDRLWDPLPFFHNGGQGPLLMALDAGATFVTTPHFDPEEALDQLEQERITVMWSGFPAIVMSLIRSANFDVRRVSTIRAMYNIAPPETLRIVQAAMPNAVQMTSFGMTEAAGPITFSSLADSPDDRLDTNGPVVDALEVRVLTLDEEVSCGDEEVAPCGEIQFRGALAFDGYYEDPQRTAEVVDGDGWVHTGDLGYLRPDGRLCYVGRLKDMLKVGGENVAASEVEAVLSMHVSVRLVAVVGRPDEKYGEVPVAFVELTSGAETTAEELMEFCAKRAATFKVPREIRFITDWPMSTTKVQKHRLRELLDAEPQ